MIWIDFELIWNYWILNKWRHDAPTSFRSPAETWPGQSFWQALKKFVHDPAAGSCRIRSHAWFVLICSILNKDNKAARYQKIQKTLRDFACETLPERSRKLSQITSQGLGPSLVDTLLHLAALDTWQRFVRPLEPMTMKLWPFWPFPLSTAAFWIIHWNSLIQDDYGWFRMIQGPVSSISSAGILVQIHEC